MLKILHSFEDDGAVSRLFLMHLNDAYSLMHLSDAYSLMHLNDAYSLMHLKDAYLVLNGGVLMVRWCLNSSAGASF